MVVSLMPLAVLFGSFVVAETQGNCSYKVVTFSHWSLITIPRGSTCMNINCSRTDASIPLGCSRDFMCYFVDMPVTINCVHYACTRNYAYYTGQISEGNCSCSYNGVTYTDGENFTVVVGSKCMKMSCSNGEWSHQSWGCVRASNCVLVDEPVYTSCTKYVCKKRLQHEYYLQRVSHTTCCKWQGNHFYISGKNYTLHESVNCVEASCYDGNWTQHAKGCSVSGRCYPLGTTLLEDCSTLTCTNGTRNVQFHNQAVITTNHCQAGDKCHPVGSQFYMNICDRHVCTRKSQNVVGPEFLQQGCPDYYGVCHELGSFGLTWEIDGHLRRICRCQALGNGNLTYTCL